MTVENRPAFVGKTHEFNQNLSKETVINTGAKVAGATIIAVGLYKLATAEGINDLVIGGILMYAGYKLFTRKSSKSV